MWDISQIQRFYDRTVCRIYPIRRLCAMNQLCFLFGHREVPNGLLPILETTLEKHIISYGVTEFIVGSYGAFDHLAARALYAEKLRHPHIRLTLLLPYLPAKRTVQLPDGFNGSLYPSGLETVPRCYAIIRANQYAIDHADYLIAFAWRPASNARNLLEYAQRHRAQREQKVTLLACPD